GRGDLQSIADDAGLGEQGLGLSLVKPGDGIRVETVERGAVVLPPLQDGVPTQARLRAFEEEELEPAAVLTDRHPPLLVGVADRQVVRRPVASSHSLADPPTIRWSRRKDYPKMRPMSPDGSLLRPYHWRGRVAGNDAIIRARAAP